MKVQKFFGNNGKTFMERPGSLPACLGLAGGCGLGLVVSFPEENIAMFYCSLFRRSNGSMS